MAATYTVPSTAVYTSTVTGKRFRYLQGSEIAMATAVDMGMPGAALDPDPAPFSNGQLAYLAGGGYKTIHNWFPDARFASADTVAVGVNNFAAGHFAYAANGTETVSIVTGGHPDGGNLVRSVTAGSSFDEGVYLYSPPNIPAGSFSLGFDVRVHWPNGKLALYPRIKVQTYIDNAWGAHQIEHQVGDNQWQRIIVPMTCYNGSGTINCAISSDASSYPDAGDATVLVQFDVGNVMFTEYDAARCRDGDSDGWTWSGTPHASASTGPQP